MKLADLVDDYLKYIKVERGLSPRTVHPYASWLRNYLKWLTENGYPEAELSAFTTPVARRYLYHLSGKGYRPRTIRGVFAPLVGLGEFLVTNEVLKVNPIKAISLPKKDAAERKVVSDAEVLLLLDASQKVHPPRRGILCHVVISTLVYSGLRRNELLSLKVGDVDPAEQSLLVRKGKGSKSRKVFLPDEGGAALREWLAVRGEARHDYLFAYDGNRRLGENGLKALVEEVKTIAGLRDAQHILPHSIRHNFATRILRNGADIRAVQAALGHSSLAVTSQYLHADEEHQRNTAHLASIRPQQAQRTVASQTERSPIKAEEPKSSGSSINQSFKVRIMHRK